ncbi:unnamed protein product [Urochloa humidicola]
MQDVLPAPAAHSLKQQERTAGRRFQAGPAEPEQRRGDSSEGGEASVARAELTGCRRRRPSGGDLDASSAPSRFACYYASSAACEVSVRAIDCFLPSFLAAPAAAAPPTPHSSSPASGPRASSPAANGVAAPPPLLGGRSLDSRAQSAAQRSSMPATTADLRLGRRWEISSSSCAAARFALAEEHRGRVGKTAAWRSEERAEEPVRLRRRSGVGGDLRRREKRKEARGRKKLSTAE